LSFEMDTWECAVCLEGDDGSPIITHDCKNHKFHEKCMEQVFKFGSSACPMCRFEPAWKCTLCGDGLNLRDYANTHACRIHAFHDACLAKHMKTDTTCPTCQYKPKNLRYIRTHDLFDPNFRVPCECDDVIWLENAYIQCRLMVTEVYYDELSDGEMFDLQTAGWD
jgi:Ring finger domain